MASLSVDTEDSSYEYNYSKMRIIQALTLRNLVDKINEKGIVIDDIVDIIKEDGSYSVLYYS